jgi:hypothetical protein
MAKRKKKKSTAKRGSQRRVKCHRITDVEKLYQIINMVQIKKREANIVVVDELLTEVVKNILLDAGIGFQRKRDIGRYYYHINPPVESHEEEIGLDEFDDEGDIGSVVFDGYF